MPKHRYSRCELTHNWEDIHPLLKDSAQITYEIIRPVVLFGVSPKKRRLLQGQPVRCVRNGQPPAAEALTG
jgi:hypothetical protein